MDTDVGDSWDVRSARFLILLSVVVVLVELAAREL
jgi:hypothetical protein